MQSLSNTSSDARIGALCDEFESSWKAGSRPRIEDFLARVDEESHTVALQELLRLEIELRRSRQEEVRPQDYLVRFSGFQSAILNACAGSDVGLSTVFYDRTAKWNEADVQSHERHDTDTLVGRLQVRCPSCGDPVEVAVDTSLTDLTCTACGSHFSLVNQNDASGLAPALRRMGRFELVARLGMGAFGAVWKARDKELDRTVAIKIPRQGAMTADEQEQFFREARAAAQLRHANIVSVHEVGRDGDSVYIVSDFVHGVTLAEWLSDQKLTSREAAELCVKIATALHHAHGQGVVHRDLKPANIMMDVAAEPHLTDFGLARREVGEVTMTMDGQILGTPSYMSPEQAQGDSHQADRRSDVYSLGVILFQFLTGELPFRGNARMILHQVVNDACPSPRKLNSSVPRDLETICLKCLEKSPGARYPTAAALADDLSRYVRGEPIQARPIGNLQRALKWARRRPTAAGLIVTVFAAMAIITGGSVVGAMLMHREQQKTLLQSKRAEHNLDQALNVVDSMLMDVSQDVLMNDVEFTPLRNQLVQRAVAYYEDFLEQREDDPEFEQHIAEARLRLGEIFDLLERRQDALAVLEAAERELGDGRSHGGAALAVTRAKINLQIANVLQRSGNLPLARSRYESLVKELEPVKLQNSPDLQAELATAYNSWGVLEKRADPHRAEELYAKGLQLREQMLVGTTNVEAQKELAKSLANMAELDLGQGKPDDAITKMERSVAAWESAVANSPENLSYQVGLADGLRNLALVYADGKDNAKALELAERAQTAHDGITPVPLRFTANRLRTMRLRAYLKSRLADSANRDSALSLLSDAASEWELILKRTASIEPRHSLEAAECFADFGALLYNSGDTRRACVFLDKAVDCALGSSDGPGHGQVVDRRKVLKICQRSFQVRAKLGQTKGSARLVERARNALKASPEDLVELVAIVGRAESSGGQHEFDYELREQILQTLAAAVAGGYRDSARFQKLIGGDRMDWLNGNAEFERLTQTMQE